MNKIGNWFNRIHSNIQQISAGRYDTFGTYRKAGKRNHHKRARRMLLNEKFYNGFEEFIEEQRNKNEYDYE